MFTNKFLPKEFTSFLCTVGLLRVGESDVYQKTLTTKTNCLLGSFCRAELQPALLAALFINDRYLIATPYSDDSPVKDARMSISSTI